MIKLTIDRIEEGVAVLKTDKKNINIPLDFLPEGVKEGDELMLEILKNGAETKIKKTEAKEILNEILKNNENGM
jgi:hypothetical protein